MALNASIGMFRRVYNDPTGFVNQQRFENWRSRYDLNWSYYVGSALDSMAAWASYRSHNKLYYATRNIYNPTKRLVDFYAGTIYPGTLTADAERYEDGTVIAIPFAKKTPKQITAAIAILWKWSNWQLNKDIMIRFAAATGECLTEIVDDIGARKITFRNWYPSAVKDLVLDFRGNVKSYTIEYWYEERDDKNQVSLHKYTRKVDQDFIETLRDDQPWAFDEMPSRYENPYGFCPAVWIKHVDVGTPHGEPCMRYIEKWDQLNSLASHWLDHAHNVLEAPILVSGDNISPLNLDITDENKVDPKTPDRARQRINLIRGSAGSDIRVAEPPSGDVVAVVDRMIMEIEKDHPELTMHHEMRRMSQVTGPAVTRLFGDVEIMVNAARNSYDPQSVKLFQMALAMAGFRANEGDWGDVSDLEADRRVFLPFNLESYDRGDLQFEIAARPLVPLGHWETIQVRRSEVALEREEIMLQQLRANPTPDGEGAGGQPSGDQANQIAIRLNMRTPTQGVLQTSTPPSS